MNINDVNQDQLPIFPREIQNKIFEYLPIQYQLVNHDLRNQVYQELRSETDQKIGLYGKNLILEGLMLIEGEFQIRGECNQLKLLIYKDVTFLNQLKHDFYMNVDKTSKVSSEWRIAVQTLFCNAIDYPSGYSKGSLQKLSYTSRTAAIALDQLNELSKLEAQKANIELASEEITKKLVEIDNQMSIASYKLERSLSPLSLMRKAEEIIYDLCGGKTKFHELPILVLDPNNKNIWTNGTGYIDKISQKLMPGKSISRGLDPFNRPFLAINFSTDRVVTFHQRGTSEPYNWVEAGSGCDFLRNYGNLDQLMNCIRQPSNESKELQKAFKQLLTTGSCDYDPENPRRGKIKLAGQQ